MSFTIAIVGRPNVGKSTLFNRLVGRRLALVDDLPGVTRDRREGQARLGDLDFTIIDTAGLEEAGAESLAGRMLAQTKTAIEQADAVFFMLDAKTGPVPDDRAFADLVRRSGKPVIVVANKAEGKGSGARRAGSLRAWSRRSGRHLGRARRGAGRSVRGAARSAAGRHRQSRTPRRRRSSDDAARPIRVAVVGRPNSGKSTLVNRLLGEDRMLTGPEAGHHARHHRGRSRLEGPRLPAARHRRAAPAAAHPGEARKAFGRRHDQRHPLRRGGGAADGRRAAVRGAGPAHRRSGRARGPRAGHRASPSGICTSAAPAASASCTSRPTSGCRRSRACRWSACRA